MAGSSIAPIELSDDDEEEVMEPPAARAGKRQRTDGRSDQGETLHVAIVSDTHHKNALASLTVPPPPAGTVGVLVHCGDFEPASATNAFFRSQTAFKYKLLICGNHDGVADADKKHGTHANLERVTPGPKGALRGIERLVAEAGHVSLTYEAALERSNRMQRDASVDPRSRVDAAVLLHNSGVVLHGVTFYGLPYNVRGESAYAGFERSEDELQRIYAKIPTSTDVLLTHCGPHGVLDVEGKGRHLGSAMLRARVAELKSLRLHAFGHVHAAQAETDLPAGFEAAAAAPSDLKKCGGTADGSMRGRDVRGATQEDAGGWPLFVNAASMAVAAQQWVKIYFDQNYGPSDPKVQTRLPLAVRLEPGAAARVVNLGM